MNSAGKSGAEFLAPFLMAFAEADAGAPAIFVDELDARGFQGSSNGELVGRG
jgi:hypothetical protein